MRRVLFTFIFLIPLLTACPSSLGNSYDPPKFPSSPSTIVEENGWKSLLIIPERNGQGTEITFENYKREQDFWGITGLYTRFASQEDLLFFAEHNNLKENSKYYWQYKVDKTGQVSDKKMDEWGYLSWGVEGESSIYWYENDGIYQDGSLVSSHHDLGSVETSYAVSVGQDKDVLINGQYYFDWQSQSWRDVKPANADEIGYSIDTIKDENHLAGWGIAQAQNGKKVEFQFRYQELDLTTSLLTQSQIFTIEAESISDEVQVFGNFDKIYVFIVKRDSTAGSMYIIDRMTGQVETKFKNLSLPDPGKVINGFDGWFNVIGDGSIFYTSAFTNGAVFEDLSIYLLGDSLEFIDIMPTKVEDSVGISDIYSVGNRLYIHLRNNFCVSSGDCVFVRQVAYYEVQSQKSESVSSSYPIQKIFSSRE